jgi:DNA-binding protein YbaB
MGRRLEGTAMAHRDPVEQFAELHDRLDLLTQQMDLAQHDIGPTSGSDPGGVAKVTVDVSGQITRIEIGSGWRRSTGAAGLVGAVREAMEAARVARLRAWGDAFAKEPDTSDLRPRPTPELSDTISGHLAANSGEPLDRAGGDTALTSLLAMLDIVEHSVDDLSTRLRAATTATYQGRCASGKIQVTVLGSGEIEGIDIDDDWLPSASVAEIGEHLLQAVRAAGNVARDESAATMWGSGGAADIGRLVNDPAALAEWLRRA